MPTTMDLSVAPRVVEQADHPPGRSVIPTRYPFLLSHRAVVCLWLRHDHALLDAESDAPRRVANVALQRSPRRSPVETRRRRRSCSRAGGYVTRGDDVTRRRDRVVADRSSGNLQGPLSVIPGSHSDQHGPGVITHVYGSYLSRRTVDRLHDACCVDHEPSLREEFSCHFCAPTVKPASSRNCRSSAPSRVSDPCPTNEPPNSMYSRPGPSGAARTGEPPPPARPTLPTRLRTTRPLRATALPG